MTPARNLRLGAAGDDVRRVKEALLALGFYAPSVTRLSSDRFGEDTRAAVRRFQAANGLAADGVVGPLTLAALARAQTLCGKAEEGKAAVTQGVQPPSAPALPAHIGSTAVSAILPALSSVSDTRKAIVLDALGFAFDRQLARAFPLSLYIRGGNLYNTDLTPNVITLARIASGAVRQPQFYDGGRRELMERAVQSNPAITGADCSGGVVGLLRHAGVVAPGFDLSANGFWANARRYRRIAQNELLPADLLHREGHVGLYAGGGYAVEWMGGAYGCQLTALSARRGYSFVTGKTSRMGAWTGFLRPTYY